MRKVGRGWRLTALPRGGLSLPTCWQTRLANKDEEGRGYASTKSVALTCAVGVSAFELRELQRCDTEVLG